MEKRFGPVLFIPGENGGRYPYCHSLYIEADLRVIIDPASDRERLKELLDGPGVDAAWLSHYHEDHFRHLDLFEDRDMLISERDAPALENLEFFLDFYGMTIEKEREFWRQVMLEQFHYKPRRSARLFREKEVIDLGGVTVEIIPTPGHTAGHCAFFFREPGVLFLGDYDLAPFGPWYGDAVSDIEATIASVNRLRTVPARVWIAAHEHGVFESDPGELWDRYLGVIDERESKLLDLLAVPRKMNEIVDARILYGKKREPKEFYDFGERSHMDKHLERLIRRGVVICDEGTYCRA
ncbi:MAG: MBL fold metallo-hydrolase [Desulfobacterales bacterium]|nr:MBL fold metallo-hydrolase [Desulfobacterales bacterium]